MDPKDRRKHPRYEATFQVDLLNMGDDPSVSQFEAIIHGVAMDVSRQGMRVKVPYNVPVGSMLSIILYSQQGGESLCLCEVMWRQDELGEPVYGVFTRSWSKLDARLAKIFESMEAGTSQAA
jgi:hypothetical protein